LISIAAENIQKVDFSAAV